MFDQPADQVGIPGGQMMALAEQGGVDGAEFRMIAATALGDVVIQAGHVQQVRLGQPAEDLPGQRALFLVVGARQFAQVLNQVQGVGIDCVDVEQVVLHLADDPAEFGQVAPENAIAVHTAQIAVYALAAAQQFDEQAGVADVAAEVVVDQVPVVAQQANAVGPDAADLLVLGHQHEDFQQREGGALEYLGVGHLDIVIAHLEAGVQRLDICRLGIAQQDFLEVLHQQVIELRQRHDDAVVLLHEAFDRQLGIVVLEAEQSRQGSLVIEQQSVFSATGQGMQCKAYLPEEGSAAGQDVVLGLVEKPLFDQFAQVAGAEVAQRHPADGLDIPQATGRAFDVGFEVVLGVIELGMPVVLLGALGTEKFGTGPHMLRADGIHHGLAQGFFTDQGARLHEVGNDGHIGASLLLALVDAAYALADFQADIPEQSEKA